MYKKENIFCGTVHEKLVKMEDLLVILLNKKSSALPGTMNLVLTHDQSVTIVGLKKKVHLLEILFCNGFKTLANMRG